MKADVRGKPVADLTEVEAAGFDPVLLETVGVGQGEVEICRAADTTAWQRCRYDTLPAFARATFL